jgi:hypothetical protein
MYSTQFYELPHLSKSNKYTVEYSNVRVFSINNALKNLHNPVVTIVGSVANFIFPNKAQVAGCWTYAITEHFLTMHQTIKGVISRVVSTKRIVRIFIMMQQPKRGHRTESRSYAK